MKTERQLITSAASHMSWANTPDRTARTFKAREAALARFEKEVDPEGLLPEEERRLRAESLRRAYMRSLALKSRKSRAANKTK